MKLHMTHPCVDGRSGAAVKLLCSMKDPFGTFGTFLAPFWDLQPLCQISLGYAAGKRTYVPALVMTLGMRLESALMCQH
jgi:hypothetical protein